LLTFIQHEFATDMQCMSQNVLQIEEIIIQNLHFSFKFFFQNQENRKNQLIKHTQQRKLSKIWSTLNGWYQTSN